MCRAQLQSPNHGGCIGNAKLQGHARTHARIHARTHAHSRMPLAAQHSEIFFSFFFFAFIPLFVLGPSKLAKSCEKTPLFGCLMVTALPGPAALRTLWLPHGNGFALVLFFFAMETHCAEH